MKFREILLHVILYFLEYSPGLKLNPVSNWTRVNLPIQLEKFVLISSLSWFELWWLWTMKLIKPRVYIKDLWGICTPESLQAQQAARLHNWCWSSLLPALVSLGRIQLIDIQTKATVIIAIMQYSFHYIGHPSLQISCFVTGKKERFHLDSTMIWFMI